MTAKFNTKIDSRKKPPISLNMVGSLAPLSKVGIGMLVLKCRPYLAQKNGFKKMEFLFVDRKCREICDWLQGAQLKPIHSRVVLLLSGSKLLLLLIFRLSSLRLKQLTLATFLRASVYAESRAVVVLEDLAGLAPLLT